MPDSSGTGLAESRTKDDRKAMRRWVQTWKERPALEAIRRREIRGADNLKVLAVPGMRIQSGSRRTASPAHFRPGRDTLLTGLSS